MMMVARLRWLLLCALLLLLLTPCSAARGLRATAGRSLLQRDTSSEPAEEQSQLWRRRESGDDGAPAFATETGSVFAEWARFQAQEVAADYNPPGPNRDPGTPLPGGF